MDMTPEVASLLLRQHSALMEEGIGPEAKRPEDDDTLNEAWLLVRTFSVAPLRFTAHWGYEYGFVDSSEHSQSCDCTTGKVYRGELVWCQGCQTHQPNPHECRASYVVTWLTQK